MKTTTFTLTSVVLGLIAGVTVTHYHQVSEMVEKGVTMPQEMSGEREASAQPHQKKELNVQTVSHTPPAAPAKLDMPIASHSREDALLELLAEMRKEQKMLRAQLAETNREMSELTFRVDTHSDSFKPLRTDSQRPVRLETSSPQAPIDSVPSVLPAIPRGER